MSARRKKGGPQPRSGSATGTRGGASPARGARSGGRRGLPAFLLPLALTALAGALIFVTLVGRRAAPTEQSVVERMDPVAAYQRGVEICGTRNWRAALPYFRRALEGPPSREWRPHFNYAIVLNNLTLQFTTRAGQQVTATRSSAERVRLGRASLDEFWQAVQLAPDGATRAKILALRANMLILWGFPWEAFATYRTASQSDSTRTDLRARGDQLLALMQDPTRFTFMQPDSSMRLSMP
jgi:hypothetical protein